MKTKIGCDFYCLIFITRSLFVTTVCGLVWKKDLQEEKRDHFESIFKDLVPPPLHHGRQCAAV